MSMNFQMDINSTLTKSRRQPPLPRSFNNEDLNLKANSLQRPSLEIHLRTTKNISSTSFHSQYHRRNTERVLSKQRSSKLSPDHSNRILAVNQQTSEAEDEIGSQLVRILREQNDNLKGQNNFLIAKVRDMQNRQKSLRQTIRDYETVTIELKNENQSLRLEIAELTEDAKRKMDEFGKKLNLLLQERRSIESTQNGLGLLNIDSRRRSDRSDRVGLDPQLPTYVTQIQDFNQYLSTNTQSSNIKLQFIAVTPPQQNHQNDNETLLQDLNNQFQALIYSCRVEKNPQKRKEIRKRLVQLTYQMKSLGNHSK